MNINKFLKPEDINIKDIKTILFLFFLLTLSVVINFNARIYEKNIWLENPSVFFVDDVPLVRTGDPAYYLKIAQYLKRNDPIDDYFDKLYYPNISKDVGAPLISIIISYLAKGPSLKEIVSAGNFLVLACSVITTIGIFFMFHSIGRPFEGVVASVGAGISSQYFNRSSYGYIDTDILNLFFMYFLFAIIYLASKKQSWYKNIIYIVFAGLLAKLFYWWYPKPELILMSFFSLAFLTAANTKDWKKIIFNCVIYIMLSNPIIYFNSFNLFLNNPYLAGYLSANIQLTDLINTTQLNFNDIFRFIGEQTKPSLIQMFELEGSLALGIFCFTGIVLWGISHPYKFIGFLPLILFFLLSKFIGVRALFYSQPFLWFGLGYMANLVLFKFYIFQKLFLNKVYFYFLISLSLLTLIVLTNNPFKRNIDVPYISADITKALIKIKDLIPNKEKSVILTPWSYGYQSLLYNDIPVLNHNGMPTSPRHYFTSRAWTVNDIKETSKILNYVANGNIEKINNKNLNSFIDLSKDLYDSPQSNDDIYILVSDHQRLLMQNYAEVAYWDVEKNIPHIFNGKSASSYFAILQIMCEDLDTVTYTTKCADREKSNDLTIPVNLALGTWNNKPLIKRVVQITDGEIEINQEYQNPEGNIVFQIIKNSKDNKTRIFFMHEAAFQSTYNKLLHLNLSENYELVYDDYPNVKIYKVN